MFGGDRAASADAHDEVTDDGDEIEDNEDRFEAYFEEDGEDYDVEYNEDTERYEVRNEDGDEVVSFDDLVGLPD